MVTSLMKKNYLLFLLIGFVFFNYSCKKNPTEPEKLPTQPAPPSLELNVDGVSCTEAWIKVKKLNDTTFLPISLKINEKEFFHGFLAATDTVLFVDRLAPNTTYTVKGIILDTLQTAKELKVTTLPTTSHNFTWQTFTFGEHSSSVLYDVAIIDENNIWAVGEIYMNDSLGNPDPNAYNAVHWDGSTWEVKRIYTLSSCNAVDYAPLKAIWAFSDTDIVVTSGGSVGWYDSKTNKPDCSIRPLLTGTVKKIWGTSNSDLYVVGSLGNIAHYDGKSWTKIESGTTLDFHDIWGDYNARSQKWEVICIASDALIGSVQSKLILTIENNVATPILNDTLTWNLMSLWFKSGRKYYLGGKGLYSTFALDKSWEKDKSIANYVLSLAGQDVNDIMISGGYNLLAHYNGQNWKQYTGSGIPNTGTNYTRLKLLQNIVVTLGFDGSKAILVIGKR